jgi:transposase
MAIRTVGIDLAVRGYHVATILDEKGRAVGRPIRFRHRPDDLEKLVGKIREGLQPLDELTAVLEPTGMAWFPVAQWLRRAGCTVIRVKGQRVKALRRYLSEYVKTDVIDAEVLGAMPNIGRKRLTPVFLPSPRQHALARFTRQRQRYQEDIGSIRRRLLSLIRWAQPELEEALPPLQTAVSLAYLERYFQPRSVQRLGKNRLTDFLRKSLDGTHPKHGSFADELAEKLLEAARSTCKLYPGGEIDFDSLQLEVQQEIQRLRLFRDHIRRLDAEIERLYQAEQPTDHLRTIPGIGSVLAPSLLGTIHEWRRFGRQKSLRGYSGLFPRRNESGGQDSPGQRITKNGKGLLRRDLVLAADVARKFDPELAQVYYTMMVSKGKHHKQALCAVATRLLNRIHAVLKENRPYVIRDLDGRGITQSEGKAIVEARLTVPPKVRNARKKGARLTFAA